MLPRRASSPWLPPLRQPALQRTPRAGKVYRKSSYARAVLRREVHHHTVSQPNAFCLHQPEVVPRRVLLQRSQSEKRRRVLDLADFYRVAVKVADVGCLRADAPHKVRVRRRPRPEVLQVFRAAAHTRESAYIQLVREIGHHLRSHAENRTLWRADAA